VAGDKIDRKYYAAVWAALIVACFVRNAYGIYVYCAGITEISALRIVTALISIVFFEGAIPALVTFLFAWIVWRVGAMRYVRCISRKDFCCIVMGFTAASRFLVGIIDIFSVLEPNVNVFANSVLDMAALTAALLIMFFVFIVRYYRFNPVEKYNAYKLWATIYMVVAGLAAVGQNGLVLLLSDGSPASAELLHVLYQMGYTVQVGFTKVQIAASITAMCVYFVFLVFAIVLGARLDKQAKHFRDPDTRGEYYDNNYNRGYNLRSDADAVFGGYDPDKQENDGKDNVFDEFDI